MAAIVSLDRGADLGEDDRAGLRGLSQAVYPPDESANWPGRHLEWTPAEWWVRVWEWEGEGEGEGDGRQPVSCAGAVLRVATYNGRPLMIGGIGGVKTHPDHRRRGYAALAIGRAVEFFHAQPAVGFALLVCEPTLIAYYLRLGWQEFRGTLMVTQHAAPAEFTFNRVMVREVRSAGPTDGVIDLQGPPW